MLGIGIDTGGTYTDAVVVDLTTSQVLAEAKALTTKDDLSVGIGGALDALPDKLRQQARSISLSTTLATNACVEGKGGRAKLVIVGASQKALQDLLSLCHPLVDVCFDALGGHDALVDVHEPAAEFHVAGG